MPQRTQRARRDSTPAFRPAGIGARLRDAPLAVYLCAALFSFGFVVGTLRVLSEVLLHSATAPQALAVVGAALAFGGVFGLLLPRTAIRRRLRLVGLDPAAGVRPPVEPDFAAALTGALLVALACLWLVPLSLAAGLETYREFLTRHFMHPPAATRVLLLAPIALSLALVGASAAVPLIAVHGWHRLVTRSTSSTIVVWVAVLLAAAAGAGLVARVERAAALTAVSLLATFTAGLVAVLRRARAAPRPSDPLVDLVDWRRLRAPLLMAGTSAALAGVVTLASVPTTLLTIQTIAAGTATLGSASTLAIVAARILPRAPARAWPNAVLVALIGLAWCVPHLPSRLMIVGGALSACVLLSTEQVARVLGRAPGVLAAVGVSVCTGLGVGAISGAPIARASVAQAPREPAADSLHGIGHGLLRAASLRAAFVAPHRPLEGGLHHALQVDLEAHGCDTIIVCSDSNGHHASPPEAHLVRYSLYRSARALRPGGRLAIEWPNETILDACFRAAAVRGQSASLSCLMRGETLFAVVVFGPDSGSWLNQLAAPPGCTLHVSTVRHLADVERGIALLNAGA